MGVKKNSPLSSITVQLFFSFDCSLSVAKIITQILVLPYLNRAVLSLLFFTNQRQKAIPATWGYTQSRCRICNHPSYSCMNLYKNEGFRLFSTKNNTALISKTTQQDFISKPKVADSIPASQRFFLWVSFILDGFNTAAKRLKLTKRNKEIRDQGTGSIVCIALNEPGINLVLISTWPCRKSLVSSGFFPQRRLKGWLRL